MSKNLVLKIILVLIFAFPSIAFANDFMCKDAIARNDAGAIRTFCGDAGVGFMEREAIIEGNKGGIDVFGNDSLSFMCREAIKNNDEGGIRLYCPK